MPSTRLPLGPGEGPSYNEHFNGLTLNADFNHLTKSKLFPAMFILWVQLSNVGMTERYLPWSLGQR